MTEEKTIHPFVAFLKLIRFENLLIIVATQYLFRYCVMAGLLNRINTEFRYFLEMSGYQASGSMHLQLSHFDFFLLSLSTAMMAAAGYIINDYFDVKTDRINRPDRIVIDRGIKRRVAMAAHTVINVIGIGLGAWVGYKAGNYQLGLIHVFTAALLWFYSTNFKKMFFIGNVLVALLTALVPVIVSLYDVHLMNLVYREKMMMFDFNFNIFILWACGFGVFAFLTNLMREIVKDMEDFFGDMETGGRTVPIQLGYKATKNIVHIVNVITLGLLGFILFRISVTYENVWTKFQNNLSITYLILLVAIPLVIFSILLAKSDKPARFRKAGLFLKFVMLAGILYSVLVYFNFSKA